MDKPKQFVSKAGVVITQSEHVGTIYNLPGDTQVRISDDTRDLLFTPRSLAPSDPPTVAQIVQEWLEQHPEYGGLAQLSYDGKTIVCHCNATDLFCQSNIPVYGSHVLKCRPFKRGE